MRGARARHARRHRPSAAAHQRAGRRLRARKPRARPARGPPREHAARRGRDLPVIGGREVRTGATAAGGVAPRSSPPPRHLPPLPRRRSRTGDRRGARGVAGVGGDAVGGARRDLPARGGPAGRALARDAQRRHHARPVEDGARGRDRRRLRADRLLALQSALPGADLRRAAGLVARACGTSPTTARSRASCSRSRRSTSPRSAATSPPRRRCAATPCCGSRPRPRSSPTGTP